MENKLESLVYSASVIEFLTVATEYCRFMDDLIEYDRNEFIGKALKLLPLLYLKASLLPEIVLEEDELDIEKFVAQEEWQYVFNKVKTVMGEQNPYTETADLMKVDEPEVVLITISENFADIYQDMKDFISLYQMGTFEMMRDAIAECKTNFQTYWGQSLVNAMRALHFKRVHSEK